MVINCVRGPRWPVPTFFVCSLISKGLFAKSVFINTWDTTKNGKSGGNSIITIPATGTYDVDLGNDGSYELTDQNGTIDINVTIYGHSAGEIQVALRNAASGAGNLTRIRFLRDPYNFLRPFWAPVPKASNIYFDNL